jgi:hypothetical protein
VLVRQLENRRSHWTRTDRVDLDNSNARAALDIRLDPAVMGALAGLAEHPAIYWQTGGRLKWNSDHLQYTSD